MGKQFRCTPATPSTSSPSSFNCTYLATTPNKYSLFFANCNPDTTVSISLRTELFNLNPTRTKISSAHTHLPSFFFLFSVTYIVVAYSASWNSFPHQLPLYA
ncbi:hypothetical protein Fmac_026711 [Flemingia macrophylla]|uniref:CAND6/7 N-terminal domain-containing protein n=1 Tax=Flemingia macrophylla TaxID=520843 RepID=A0ABD1LFL2_9FABA